ncbi:MAG TPA: hypothetical protein VGB71_14665 [Flavisolibacter sp.]
MQITLSLKYFYLEATLKRNALSTRKKNMNKTLILFIGLSAVCLFTSCSKKTTDPEEVMATLEGTWEIRQSYSGMMPLTNYPSGNGMTVSFDGTNFKYGRNGQIVHRGIYQLKNDTTTNVSTCAKVPPKNSLPNTIVFDNNPNGVSSSFELTGNTLKLSSGCIPADGGWAVYKKISDTTGE